MTQQPLTRRPPVHPPPMPARRRCAAARALPGAGRPCAVVVAVVAISLASLLIPSSDAYAAGPDAVPVAAESIDEVVNNLRIWLVGILFAVATFFFTYGGVRYICAGGNPSEVEKAKSALKSAGIGYGLALLAPLIITVIRDVLK